MATGWIAWTYLLMAATTGLPDDVGPWNQRSMQIPIRLKPGSQAQVKELNLHLSRDQGRTWEPIAKATPDKKAFDFNSDADGLYWFAVSVVYKNGMKDPEDVSRGPVLKVLVDTLKPDARFTGATRNGEEIEARWEIIDANPDWNSLRLTYRMSNSPTAEWLPLQVLPGSQGHAKFRPVAAGDVTVRLQVKDLAGNEGMAEQVVSAGAAPGHVDHSVVGAAAVGPSFRPTEGSAPPPPSPPPGSTLSPPLAVSSAAHNTAKPPVMPPPPTGTESNPTPASTPSPTPSLSSAGPNVPQLGKLPELKIINKKQAKLDFDVVTYGPSGLGGVDVYMTTDEGANWSKYAESAPEVTLPVSAEARGAGPVRGSVSVQLPRDGVVYGFFVVVKSRAGLSKRPPAPGTAPHARIEVDTTPPTVDLYRPKPDTAGPRDTLLLTWKAEDKNLHPTPISLEWSAAKGGPWEFIGGPQLPNTGRCSWQITERVPPKVFLRLTVRDVAGNVTVAQPTDPVLIDLTEPEIANVGVSVR